MLGVTERIQDTLNNYCTGGYGGGVVGQANIRYLTENYPDLVRVVRIYRLGDALRFVTPVADSRQFGEFLNDLSGLEDYPVIDESTFDDYLHELQDDDLEEIIADNGLHVGTFWEVYNEGDYYYGWEQDYVYAEFDVTELVAKVRERTQNWERHYSNDQWHFPEACAWCKDETLPSSGLEK